LEVIVRLAKDKWRRDVGKKSDRALLALSAGELQTLVEKTARSYYVDSELASSPLATSSLCASALLPDGQDVTPVDRAMAVRDVIDWAIARIAPVQARSPEELLEKTKPSPPVDDRWNSYNVLVYKFLRSHHDGPQSVHLSLSTGGRANRSGPDEFNDRRRFKALYRRAIGQLVEIVRGGLIQHRYARQIERWAIQSLQRRCPLGFEERRLASLAASFRGAIPRDLLLNFARLEHIPQPDKALDSLIGKGILRVRNNGQYLVMPVGLKNTHLRRIPFTTRTMRHSRAIEYYRDQGNLIEMAWHMLQAGHVADAADVIIVNQRRLLTAENRVDDVYSVLKTFSREGLEIGEWAQIQQCLANAQYLCGDAAGSLRTTRSLLKQPLLVRDRVQALLWLATLQKGIDWRQALVAIDEALALTTAGDVQRLYCLLHSTTVRLEQFETDGLDGILADILARAPDDAVDLRAYALANMADYYRISKDLPQALDFAQQGLSLWESIGDTFQIVYTHNLIALILMKMRRIDEALCHIDQAELRGRSLAESTLTITTWQLRGQFHICSQQREEATMSLLQAREIARRIDEPGMAVNLDSQLFDHFAAHQMWDEARYHFLAGYITALLHSPQRFVAHFQSRYKKHAFLHDMNFEHELSERELLVLDIALSDGRITRRLLIESFPVSTASATRILGDLCARKLLISRGAGRSQHYVLSGEPAANVGNVGTSVLSGEAETAWRMVLDRAKKGERITPGAMLKSTRLSKATVHRLLKRMVEKKILVRHGAGRNTHYLLGSGGD